MRAFARVCSSDPLKVGVVYVMKSIPLNLSSATQFSHPSALHCSVVLISLQLRHARSCFSLSGIGALWPAGGSIAARQRCEERRVGPIRGAEACGQGVSARANGGEARELATSSRLSCSRCSALQSPSRGSICRRCVRCAAPLHAQSALRMAVREFADDRGGPPRAGRRASSRFASAGASCTRIVAAAMGTMERGSRHTQGKAGARAQPQHSAAGTSHNQLGRGSRLPALQLHVPSNP